MDGKEKTERFKKKLSCLRPETPKAQRDVIHSFLPEGAALKQMQLWRRNKGAHWTVSALTRDRLELHL